MEVQLVRSATMRWTYAGHRFLTDPYFAARATWPPLAGKSHNPQVDLPIPPSEVLAGVDAVLLSHLHPDHFDPVAEELVPKDLPLFCQPCDEQALRDKGFHHVIPVRDSLDWNGVSLSLAPGQHGCGVWAERMGSSSGYVLQASGEPTVYWAGDTVWSDPVREAILRYQPAVIITHSSGADFGDSGPIIMDAAQTLAVCEAAPAATVIAVHMDAFDFDTESRASLRAAARRADVSPARLRIPEDGETLSL